MNKANFVIKQEILLPKALKRVLKVQKLSSDILPAPSPRTVSFNLFWFTAPCKTEKNLADPYPAKMTIWGTLISKIT